MYLKNAQYEKPCLYAIPHDQSDPTNRLFPEREETLTLEEEIRSKYEKPCLYAIPHDQFDPANRLVPEREETLTLEEESRSKLNKDLVKPFDYTRVK
ncbi:hypothetical protein Tco_0947061 [Tanacetum coccineum]